MQCSRVVLGCCNECGEMQGEAVAVECGVVS